MSDLGSLLKIVVDTFKSWFLDAAKPLELRHRLACALMGPEIFVIAIMLLYQEPIKAIPYADTPIKFWVAVVAIFLALSFVCFILSLLVALTDKFGRPVRLFLGGIILHVLVMVALHLTVSFLQGILNSVGDQTK